MEISNNDKDARSAFVYNQEDTSRSMALASKAINSGDRWDYDPPENGSGFYTVLIHYGTAGGKIMAIGSGKKNAKLGFNGLTLCPQ